MPLPRVQKATAAKLFHELNDAVDTEGVTERMKERARKVNPRFVSALVSIVLGSPHDHFVLMLGWTIHELLLREAEVRGIGLPVVTAKTVEEVMTELNEVQISDDAKKKQIMDKIVSCAQRMLAENPEVAYAIKIQASVAQDEGSYETAARSANIGLIAYELLRRESEKRV